MNGASGKDRKKVNLPKPGAARKWAARLKELREQKPPKELMDLINATPRQWWIGCTQYSDWEWWVTEIDWSDVSGNDWDQMICVVEKAYADGLLAENTKLKAKIEDLLSKIRGLEERLKDAKRDNPG